MNENTQNITKRQSMQLRTKKAKHKTKLITNYKPETV